MAKYNKFNETVLKAKTHNIIMAANKQSTENTLKTYNKLRMGTVLYDEGILWFKTGKRLEEATETVTFEGKEVKKCNQINFKQGYFSKAYDLGYSLGYNGDTVDKLPAMYVNYAQFLNGYKQGVLDLENGVKRKR